MMARSSSRSAVAVVAALMLTANAFAQTHGVARTPWGDPDLQGTFTNKDEAGTPFERQLSRRRTSATRVPTKRRIRIDFDW
jgi:hypothetical protein